MSGGMWSGMRIGAAEADGAARGETALGLAGDGEVGIEAGGHQVGLWELGIAGGDGEIDGEVGGEGADAAGDCDRAGAGMGIEAGDAEGLAGGDDLARDVAERDAVGVVGERGVGEANGAGQRRFSEVAGDVAIEGERAGDVPALGGEEGVEDIEIDGAAGGEVERAGCGEGDGAGKGEAGSGAGREGRGDAGGSAGEIGGGVERGGGQPGGEARGEADSGAADCEAAGRRGEGAGERGVGVEAEFGMEVGGEGREEGGREVAGGEAEREVRLEAAVGGELGACHRKSEVPQGNTRGINDLCGAKEAERGAVPGGGEGG